MKFLMNSFLCLLLQEATEVLLPGPDYTVRRSGSKNLRQMQQVCKASIENSIAQYPKLTSHISFDTDCISEICSEGSYGLNKSMLTAVTFDMK